MTEPNEDWPEEYEYEDGPDLPDGDEDDGSECGGWINGTFDWSMCTLAGTEDCDWECPYAREFRARSKWLRT